MGQVKSLAVTLSRASLMKNLKLTLKDQMMTMTTKKEKRCQMMRVKRLTCPKTTTSTCKIVTKTMILASKMAKMARLLTIKQRVSVSPKWAASMRRRTQMTISPLASKTTKEEISLWMWFKKNTNASKIVLWISNRKVARESSYMQREVAQHRVVWWWIRRELLK